MVGCSLQPGCDSHVSPDGHQEVVIFDAKQILPCYIVHYATQSADAPIKLPVGYPATACLDEDAYLNAVKAFAAPAPVRFVSAPKPFAAPPKPKAKKHAAKPWSGSKRKH